MKIQKDVISISFKDMRPGLFITIAFIIGKMTGGIAWSWWWVFSPIIFNALILAIVCVAFSIVVAIRTVREFDRKSK